MSDDAKDSSNPISIAEGILIAVGVLLVLVGIVLVVRWMLRRPKSRLANPVLWSQGSQRLPIERGTDRDAMYKQIQEEFMKLRPVKELTN